MVRITIRRYAGDQQEHGYLAEQLTGPGRNLTPICARAYPRRHPRGQLGSDDLPGFGNALSRCASCAVSMRRIPHEIVVQGAAS